MIFEDPRVLILAPIILLLIFFAGKWHKKPAIRFSSGELLAGSKPSLRLRLAKYSGLLRLFAVLFFLLAIARPREPLEEVKTYTEGIDIVLAVDVSTSMRAEDFTIGKKRINRLDAVKDVIKDFIERRPNDKIGMIVFAGRSYTVCPLTLDHGWLLRNLDRVEIGMIEDGTAIGSGISSALNRLKDTKAKDKVIILLTDGRNNSGKISPVVAAEAARTLDVKIYTVGAGSRGFAPYPVKDKFGRIVYTRVKIDIDEDVLKKIAKKTSGRYYRATDTDRLREIYKEIDKLETYPIEEKGYLEYKELFPLFLIPGLILLFLEIILSNTIFRRIP
ncbi:VWA domain-containing protein [Candidatus Omnitrophota bacterium]